MSLLNLTRSNRAAEVKIESVSLRERYGDAEPRPGRIFLCVGLRWENTIPMTLVYQQQVPTTYKIPNLADHLYVVINGREVARLDPKLCALPGHLPTTPLALERAGSVLRGNVLFEVPAPPAPLATLELRFYDYTHGHMSAELMKAPDAAGQAKAVGALRANQVIEAGIYGIQEAEQYAGQKAPEGMTFLILELRARSTVTLEADATAFDPKAVKGEKGAKLQVGTVADWKESRKYTQLVVDGQYAYAPLAASELAPEPRFLPDLMTGGRLVFLAPAAHQSLELLCEFPNAAIPGASKTIRPTALLLPLAGTRPPPAELKPTAAIRDGVFTVSVVGQSTRATFAGARASAGNQFLVLDVVVENTGAKGEIFQTRSQLKHAAEGGSQSTLDPASHQGLRPPMDLLWVPAGPRTQKGFLRSVLATTEGESGPIVLYFERDETGGRAKTKLLGGVMGVVPMVAQELLGVGECREGDSNPHSLNGH